MNPARLQLVTAYCLWLLIEDILCLRDFVFRVRYCISICLMLHWTNSPAWFKFAMRCVVLLLFRYSLCSSCLFVLMFGLTVVRLSLSCVCLLRGVILFVWLCCFALRCVFVRCCSWCWFVSFCFASFGSVCCLSSSCLCHTVSFRFALCGNGAMTNAFVQQLSDAKVLFRTFKECHNSYAKPTHLVDNLAIPKQFCWSVRNASAYCWIWRLGAGRIRLRSHAGLGPGGGLEKKRDETYIYIYIHIPIRPTEVG